MNNYQELEKHCKSFTKGFESIKQYALDFATSRKPIKKVMNEILRSGPDGIAMEYEIQNSFLFMIAEVFQNPKMLKQIQTKHEAALTSEGRKVLTFWQENPAFWCYFTVKGHLSGDFWMIEDKMTGEEHILYSKGISSMQKEKESDSQSFLCIMQPNGQCLQTVGIIKRYLLPVSDFLFYCTLFKPEESLKAILYRHFVKFWELDTVAHMTAVKHQSYELGYTWQPFSLAEFDTAKLGGKWNTWKHDSLEKYFIKEPDEGMASLPGRELLETAIPAMGASIVRDPKTGDMGLATNSEVAYPFYAAILDRAYPELQLPKKPSLFVSMAIRTLAQTADLPFPWKKFQSILEYSEEPKRDVGFDMDVLVGQFQEAYLNNTPLDFDKVAKASGLDREFVKDLWERFDQDDGFFDQEDEEDEEDYIYYVVPDEDKGFELGEFPMPDDLLDEVLYHSLPDSEIYVFLFDRMAKAHKIFLQLANEEFAQEIQQLGMLRSIQRLFTTTFEKELAYPVMNSFFWILSHKGKDWVPVRSYAIEMLKWIPTEILHVYGEQELFIQEFSMFVKRQLCTKGICTLAKRPTAEELKKGTYSIKGTDAFFTLLKIREEDD